MNITTLPATGFVRLAIVLALFPVSKSSWFAGIKAGIYPQPVKLGPRMAAYRVEDIKALIERVSATGNEQTADMQQN